MVTGSIALLFFYGIFWGTLIGAIGQYHPFSTAAFWSESRQIRCRSINRFIASLIFMNIFPILWLWLLYSSVVPNTSGVRAILAAAFASLSVFGWHRILYAVIVSDRWRSWFYSDEMLKEIRDKRPEESNEFRAHLIPGLAYLLVPVGVLWLIRLIAFLIK